MSHHQHPVTVGMILAAGQGTRMRELTQNTPKPLLEVHGKALIEYRIEAYKKAGIKNIVINVSLENHGQQIIDRLGDGCRYGVTIHYSIEEKALGTGGGIVKALPLLGDTFWVCGADVWTDFSFRHCGSCNNTTSAAIRHHEEPSDAAIHANLTTKHAVIPDSTQRVRDPGSITNPDAGSKADMTTLAHLVLVPNPDHNHHGDFGLENGFLLNSPKTHTFSGVVLYHRDLFLNAPAGNFHVIDLVRKAINKKHVTGELHSGVWVDVGTPERLLALQHKDVTYF